MVLDGANASSLGDWKGESVKAKCDIRSFPFHLYGSHYLDKGGMDALPWLREVERQSANTVAVRGKSDGEVARSARVKEDTLGLLPAGLTSLLAQVGKKLIKIGRKEFWRPVRAGLECLGIEFGVDYDRTTRTAETHVGFHAWHQRQCIRIWGNKLPLDYRSADVP